MRGVELWLRCVWHEFREHQMMHRVPRDAPHNARHLSDCTCGGMAYWYWDGTPGADTLIVVHATCPIWWRYRLRMQRQLPAAHTMTRASEGSR